MLIWHYKIRG